MSTYSVLFLGDVVGKPGRTALKLGLASLKQTYSPLFTIVNGENSAGGVGITPSIANEIFQFGADAITLGNHAFHKREIDGYLNDQDFIVRPANMPRGTPGRGVIFLQKDLIRFCVINLCGQTYMDAYNNPFGDADRILTGLESHHGLLDFHGEATSEKVAMGYFCDGRISAVVGTHTHVQTADETVLQGGTAYITDVGMTGPKNSVLGMDRNIILKRFVSMLPQKFQVADEDGVICGVAIDVERDSGLAASIERIKFAP
jgi:metallophosphoesterase (TIGR00282 family)